MSKKNITLDPFQAWCHRWGRIGTLIALVYMIYLPFIVLNYYDCVPSLGSVFNVATFGILAIYIPVGISEALSYTSTADMMANASASEFGVVLILMSVGMLSGFLILIPFGKKLMTSVDKTKGGNGWSNVLSGCFMLVLLAVYVPVLLICDTYQALVMITGLIVAIVLGIVAKKPGMAWLNNFIMAGSMIVGMVSALLWTSIF